MPEGECRERLQGRGYGNMRRNEMRETGREDEEEEEEGRR